MGNHFCCHVLYNYVVTCRMCPVILISDILFPAYAGPNYSETSLKNSPASHGHIREARIFQQKAVSISSTSAIFCHFRACDYELLTVIPHQPVRQQHQETNNRYNIGYLRRWVKWNPYKCARNQDSTAYSCRHIKSSAWVRSMYCVCVWGGGGLDLTVHWKIAKLYRRYTH
jgi:hypothetical protein